MYFKCFLSSIHSTLSSVGSDWHSYEGLLHMFSCVNTFPLPHLVETVCFMFQKGSDVQYVWHFLPLLSALKSYMDNISAVQ